MAWGGKTSAGFGKFRIAGEEERPVALEGSQELQSLGRSLAAQKGPYLLLTTSLPEEEELEGALKDGDFRLIRRSGFVQAELSTAMKKRSQYFLSAGAVVQAPFQGERCIRWATQALTRCTAMAVHFFVGGGRMKELGHLQVYDLIFENTYPPLCGGEREEVCEERISV